MAFPLHGVFSIRHAMWLGMNPGQNAHMYCRLGAANVHFFFLIFFLYSINVYLKQAMTTTIHMTAKIITGFIIYYNKFMMSNTIRYTLLYTFFGQSTWFFKLFFAWYWYSALGCHFVTFLTSLLPLLDACGHFFVFIFILFITKKYLGQSFWAFYHSNSSRKV